MIDGVASTADRVPAARQAAAEPPGWATLVAFGAVLVLCYVLRYALLPFVIVAALAFVLRPLSRVLQRRLHVPKIVSVLMIYFAVLALTGGAIWYVVAAVGDQIVSAASEAPKLLADKVREFVGPQVHLFGRDFTADDIVRHLVSAIRERITSPEFAPVAGVAVVGMPLVGVLMLALLFYFLNSGRQLAQGALHLFPPRYRGHLAHLGARAEPMLRRYVRGVATITLYTAVVSWLVLGLWFHVAFALPISLVVGMLELIPAVGPAASVVLFSVAGLVSGGGVWTFASFFALAVFLRISVDNVIGPVVLGRAVTLHPVVIIVAFLIGASLFGALGVFLAVPMAAAVRIVLAAWYGEDEGAA